MSFNGGAKQEVMKIDELLICDEVFEVSESVWLVGEILEQNPE